MTYIAQTADYCIPTDSWQRWPERLATWQMAVSELSLALLAGGKSHLVAIYSAVF